MLVKITLTFEGDTYEDSVEIQQFLKAREMALRLFSIREGLISIINQDPEEWIEVEQLMENMLEECYVEGVIE